jgi:hypothetical protein
MDEKQNLLDEQNRCCDVVEKIILPSFPSSGVERGMISSPGIFMAIGFYKM